LKGGEPVVGVFVVHPHEVFLEPVNLRLSTDDPVIVHDHAVNAALLWRKNAISFLEIVHAAQVPVRMSTISWQTCLL